MIPRRFCESPRNDDKVDCHESLRDSRNDEWTRFYATSAEVFLGDFKGFRARNYEIRLIVYRIVERDESLKSVKKTLAP